MNVVECGNLLANLSGDALDEEIATLVSGAALWVERIVSTGQASPTGFWYDQEQAEMVVVLAGAAELRFEAESAARRLAPGDWLNIPARCRHRVEWTDPDRPTVWLAIHYASAHA
jgi:cupin 2 domain-containing protein